MIKLTRAKRKTHISALIYGAPGTGKKTLALGFPNPIAVDAHGTIDTSSAPDNIRILRASTPGPILELIAKLAKEEERADTLVLIGSSRVYDEIQASSEGNGARYYSACRKYFTNLTDQARALPMHVIFTARTKDSWARTGDVIANYVVGPEDKIVKGTEPDIDRNLAYDVDLVLELTVKEDGHHIARVVSSHLPEIVINSVIEDPTAEKLLALCNFEAPAPIDLQAIQDHDERFGSIEHLRTINSALNLTTGASLTLKERLVKLKLWDGTSTLQREQHVAIAKALTAARDMKPSPSTSQPAASSEPHPDTTASTSIETTVRDGPILNAAQRQKVVDACSTRGIDPNELVQTASGGKASSLVDPALDVDAIHAIAEALEFEKPSSGGGNASDQATDMPLSLVDQDLSAAVAKDEELTPEQTKLVSATIEEVGKLPEAWRIRLLDQLATETGERTISWKDVPRVQLKLAKARKSLAHKAA